MATVNNRRFDVEKVPEWGRKLRALKSLTYTEQLELFNTLIVLKDTFMETRQDIRRHETLWKALNPSLGVLSDEFYGWELSGMVDERAVHAEVCRMMSAVEVFNASQS